MLYYVINICAEVILLRKCDKFHFELILQVIKTHHSCQLIVVG